MSHDDDGELFKRFVSGSQAAFAELYRRHSDRLFRTTKRRFHLSAQNADEVCQETWIAASQSRLFDGQFFPWLLGIARNKALRFFRQKKKDQKSSEQLRQFDVCEEVSRSPQDRIIQQDTVKELQEAMEELPAETKEALALVSFYGQTIVATACRLGIPERTLGVRLQAAKKHLRDAIST